jgi:DNA-binding NarL/FixJ family response regulator
VPSPASPQSSSGSLTPRELEVLALLANGLTNREIADELMLSVKTVMHHSVAIYRKLDVRGRAEATAYAHRHGLVTAR